MRLLVRTLSTLAAIALGTACTADIDAPESFEAFLATVEQDSDTGFYIVESELSLFDLESLRSYYEDTFATERHLMSVQESSPLDTADRAGKPHGTDDADDQEYFCYIPSGWCVQWNQTMLHHDCNGDGKTDTMCYDNNGNRWSYTSYGNMCIVQSNVAASHCPYIFDWHRIARWSHTGDGDWVDIQDVDMSQWGYQNKVDMFSLQRASSSQMSVAVHRWWHSGDKDWITIPASGSGHLSDATMTSYGYSNKTFLGYASSTSFAGSVAVSRWWHSGDKDWVTIPAGGAGHLSDATMTSYGYSNKTFLFHARY